MSREVARHGGRPAYRASQADGEAWQSALRPKRCLLARNHKLQNIVASKLILDWSPKQISGWLKTQYPDDESARVSHETIYRSLFIQARGALKKELLEQEPEPLPTDKIPSYNLTAQAATPCSGEDCASRRYASHRRSRPIETDADWLCPSVDHRSESCLAAGRARRSRVRKDFHRANVGRGCGSARLA